jgi:hypothetical protein
LTPSETGDSGWLGLKCSAVHADNRVNSFAFCFLVFGVQCHFSFLDAFELLYMLDIWYLFYFYFAIGLVANTHTHTREGRVWSPSIPHKMSSQSAVTTG